MKKKFLIVVLLGVVITSQLSCIQDKRIYYNLHSTELQNNLIELNDISKEIHKIVKTNRSWRDTATILLVNELIIEVTNLLLIDKLSNISLSAIKDEYKKVYSDNVKIRLEFIRETIRKNNKGIHLLSETSSIRDNKPVSNQIIKVNKVIKTTIILLDKDIENLEKM